MEQPGLKKNKNTEKTNQKKGTNDGISISKKQSITSAQFQKMKKIFEPSNQSGQKKKFAMNSFKFQRLQKLFELPSNQTDKKKALPNIHQTIMPNSIPNQSEAHQTQKKNCSTTTKNN